MEKIDIDTSFIAVLVEGKKLNQSIVQSTEHIKQKKSLQLESKTWLKSFVLYSIQKHIYPLLLSS